MTNFNSNWEVINLGFGKGWKVSNNKSGIYGDLNTSYGRIGCMIIQEAYAKLLIMLSVSCQVSIFDRLFPQLIQTEFQIIMNKSMKSIIILGGTLLVLGAFFYLNHQYGLLSMAGLNGKGLPAKTVKGSLASAPPISKTSTDHSQWTALLKKYVGDDGKVDYKGFLQQKNKLDDYLNALSKQVPKNAWSVEEQLAYYVNLYNAHTVNLILENYPVKSIKDIDRPWAKDIITIGDKKLSLGALEHSILRKMNEPRIHFAINCASASCPKLLNEAFTPEKLDEQLEEATRGFMNSDNNGIGRENLELSRIFKWFKGDFENGKLVQFIEPYTNVEIDPKAKIKYKEYDWSLNGSSEKSVIYDSITYRT